MGILKKLIDRIEQYYLTTTSLVEQDGNQKNKPILDRIEEHYLTTSSGIEQDDNKKKKPTALSLDQEDWEILKNIKDEVVNRKRISTIDLNSKVDEFIDWYYKNMVKGNYTDIGCYRKPIELRNFIEKMAVWYELRYPSYEVNRLMPGSGQEYTKIDNVMFDNNNYINNFFDENSEVRLLEWEQFYNTNAFIKSLPYEERYIFENRYRNLVYVDPDYAKYDVMESKRKSAHLHLNDNGIVREAENFDLYTQFKISNEELKGMHVKEVVQLLKERGVEIPKNNELEEAIAVVEKWDNLKEETLNCVMYRIIERGGNRIGPRRAFIFAKEFGRNIDIPMMYGVDYSDPGLRHFINEYIKAGGSTELVCYEGYFYRKASTQTVSTVSLKRLLKLEGPYTKEERELYQRLVDLLAIKADFETEKKEKVKQLRLERRLEKSRKNSN